MPKVGRKHFSYTPAGKRMAAKERKKRSLQYRLKQKKRYFTTK
jgi:hypothetical protein